KLKAAAGAWQLSLTLDDKGLPVPYVIDPAISLKASSTAAADATSVAVSIPTGTAQNDVMLAQIAVIGGTGQTITPPSGWTLIRRDNSTNKDAQAIYYKVAGSSEPASYTFTVSASNKIVAGIVSYSGVDVSNPIDVSSGANGTGTATLTAPSLTT